MVKNFFTYLLAVFSMSHTALGQHDLLSLSQGKNAEQYLAPKMVVIDGLIFDLQNQKLLDIFDLPAFDEVEDISRWLARDPQESKYVGFSPYHFAANSPMIVMDPNGEEWLIDVDTKAKTITLTFTGKLIDETGAVSGADMEAYTQRINSSIEASFQGKTPNGFTVTTKSKITVLKQGEVLAANDHALRIVNQIPVPGEENSYGFSATGGKWTYLQKDILERTPATEGEYKGTGLSTDGKPTLERTAAHEAGHTAGLYHPGRGTNCECQENLSLGDGFHRIVYEKLSQQNLMHQSTTGGKASPLAGTKLIPEQLKSIALRINDTKLGINKNVAGVAMQNLPVNDGPQQYTPPAPATPKK